MCRDAHLTGLNSLQGKDRVIAEALKHLQGIGRLDAYTVKVGLCDSCMSCVWEDSQCYLDGIDNRNTRIGYWMSLDGSKPGFSEIQNDEFDATGALNERIMQVSTSHVCDVFWSGVLWCRLKYNMLAISSTILCCNAGPLSVATVYLKGKEYFDVQSPVLKQ